MGDKKKKVGRPSTYNALIAAEICSRISDGISLRTICKADDMPCTATIFIWFGKHPDFVEQYTRACEARAEAIFEESLEIADDGTNDWMASNKPDNAGYIANGEHIQRSRLRVETRKWFVAKLNPKKYGDRVQQEITGKDGGPIQTEDVSARDFILKQIDAIGVRLSPEAVPATKH